MADKPILFSGPMVRAILDGRKTQTRRVLKPQPVARVVRPNGFFGVPSFFSFTLCDDGGANSSMAVPITYAPGDRLWVRETLECANGGAIGYPADGTWYPNTPWQWKRQTLPSIHMPRSLSRLTLIVTDVRVQRLQEISGEDCIAEGVKCDTCSASWSVGRSACNQRGCFEVRQNFHDLWDSLNARRGYGWDENPWVCAITFKAYRCNIDQMPTPPQGDA